MAEITIESLQQLRRKFAGNAKALSAIEEKGIELGLITPEPVTPTPDTRRIIPSTVVEEEQPSPLAADITAPIIKPKKTFLTTLNDFREDVRKVVAPTHKELVASMSESSGKSVEEIEAEFQRSRIAGLRGAQLAAGFLTGGIAAPAALVGTAEFGVQKLKGKDNEDAAKTALFAGTLDALTGEVMRIGGKALGSKALQPLVKPLADISRKSVSFVAEALSSVPRESFEKALQLEAAGKSLFRKKFNKLDYDLVGKKAQNAMNEVLENAGKQVAEENAALKGKTNKFINVEGLVEKIDQSIDDISFEEITSLSKADLDELQEIKKLLKPDRTVEIAEGRVAPVISAPKLNVIKRKLQNMVKFDPNVVKKTSTEGDRIIKGVASDIREKLNLAVPELGEANAKFKKAADLKAALITNLKDKNIERNMKSLARKDEFTQNLFRQLDEAASDKNKFLDELDETMIRDVFNDLFPGKGGGSGSQQGMANFVRLSGLGAVGAGTGGLGLAGAPLISPAGQRQLIRGGVAAGRGIGRAAEFASRGKGLAAGLAAEELTPVKAQKRLIRKIEGGE